MQVEKQTTYILRHQLNKKERRRKQLKNKTNRASKGKNDKRKKNHDNTWLLGKNWMRWTFEAERYWASHSGCVCELQFCGDGDDEEAEVK